MENNYSAFYSELQNIECLLVYCSNTFYEEKVKVYDFFF